MIVSVVSVTGTLVNWFSTSIEANIPLLGSILWRTWNHSWVDFMLYLLCMIFIITHLSLLIKSTLIYFGNYSEHFLLKFHFMTSLVIFMLKKMGYLWVLSWARYSVISTCLTAKIEYLIALKPSNIRNICWWYTYSC